MHDNGELQKAIAQVKTLIKQMAAMQGYGSIQLKINLQAGVVHTIGVAWKETKKILKTDSK